MGFGTDECEPEEHMNRLTIDVPVELHRRIKAALMTSSVLRDPLERKFQRRQGNSGCRSDSSTAPPWGAGP